LLLELEGLIQDVRAALWSEWAAYTKQTAVQLYTPVLSVTDDRV